MSAPPRTAGPTVTSSTITSRAQDVQTLLTGLTLTIPDPRTWTGSISAGAQPGEAAVKKIACPNCEGTGQRRRRGIEQPCDAPGCHNGKVMVDPQTTKRALVTSTDEPHEMTGPERAAWHGVVDAKLAQVGSVIAQHDDSEAAIGPLERSSIRRDDLDKHGSFAELRNALDWLRDTEPIAHRLVVQFLIYPWPAAPSPAVQDVLDTALELLALRMPVPIRVPGYLRNSNTWREKRTSLARGKTDRHTQQRLERQAEVEALYAQGWSTDEIALRLALSDRQVRRIRTGDYNGQQNGEAA